MIRNKVTPETERLHLEFLLKKERETREKEHEFIDELLKDKRILEHENRQLKEIIRHDVLQIQKMTIRQFLKLKRTKIH